MKLLEMLIKNKQFPIYVMMQSYENLKEIVTILEKSNPMSIDMESLEQGYNNYLADGEGVVKIYKDSVFDNLTFCYVSTKYIEQSEILCDCYALGNICALGEVKSLNEISNPKQIKEETMANRVKVFEKGEPQVQQIISQMFIFGLTDDRPFVNRLVSAELDRIKQDLNQGILVKPAEDCYNIKLLSAYYSLSKLVESNEEVDLSDALEYYVYLKEMKRETNPKTKADYSWIKDYLTQKNINSGNEVVLFESNKLKILIEDGYIRILTKKTGMEMSVEIKYSTATNTFHL